MKPRLTILAFFTLILATNTFAQAKLEGTVSHLNGGPAARVSVVAPGGQPTTTDSKGHFLIHFPNSTSSGQPTRIHVPYWKVFDPVFGVCWTQHLERSVEPLLVTIVRHGSTAAHIDRAHLPAVLEAFQKENKRLGEDLKRLNDKIAQQEFEAEKYAFLRRYQAEYGVPLDKLKAALDRWVQTEKSDNLIVRARQEYWNGNFQEVHRIIGDVRKASDIDLATIREEQLKETRKRIDAEELDGISYFREFRFAEALEVFNGLERLFESRVISKDDFTKDWANLRLWIGRTKLELGNRVAGTDGPRLLNEALAAFESIAPLFDRAQAPKEWAVYQLARATALLYLGRRTAGARSIEYLNEAEIASRAAVDIRRGEHGSEEWAVAQNGLSSVLITLSERFEGTKSIEYLKSAEQINRELLVVRKPQASSEEWIRRHNNLGLTLSELGRRVEGAESIKYLTEAIELYRTGMKPRKREPLPEEWAQLQEHMGQTLTEMGRRVHGDEGIGYLKESVDAHRAVLKVRVRDQLPQLWAYSQISLGNALLSLAGRTEGTEKLKLLNEAVTALRDSLGILTFEVWPYDWARAQISLGGALSMIAERTPGAVGDKYLEEAERILTAAQVVIVRKYFPQQWAMIQNNRGVNFYLLGLRNFQSPPIDQQKRALIIDQLKKAVSIFHESGEVFTHDSYPQLWANTMNELVSPLVLLAQLLPGTAEGAKYLDEAEAANRAVLAEPRALPMEQREHPLLQQGAIKMMRGDRAGAADAWARALEYYPDNAQIYRIAVSIYHEEIFRFDHAYKLQENWLARHKDDLAVQVDFAETHFTTGRFAESQQRITDILSKPEVPVSSKVALRGIEIASLFALGRDGEVPEKLDALITEVSHQPDNFTVPWSFNGSVHFIEESKNLTRHREWLKKLIAALKIGNRDTILIALQAMKMD